MTKASTKSRGRAKSKKRAKATVPRAPQKARTVTKHDRVIGLLRGKRGATIAAISKVTGWQPHSVRGFLAGVVRKKLGLLLLSEELKSGRVYRIVATKTSVSCPASMTQERGNE
jgi:hypothetical protein